MVDLANLAKIDNKLEAADAISSVLYGRDGERIAVFRLAFFEGAEDEVTSNWVEARGIGPRSVGYNLGAVWKSKGCP